MFGERRALLEVDLAVLLNLHERLAKSATQSSGATGMDLSSSRSLLSVFRETKNQEFHLKMGSTTLNFRGHPLVDALHTQTYRAQASCSRGTLSHSSPVLILSQQTRSVMQHSDVPSAEINLFLTISFNTKSQTTTTGSPRRLRGACAAALLKTDHVPGAGVSTQRAAGTCQTLTCWPWTTSGDLS